MRSIYGSKNCFRAQIFQKFPKFCLSGTAGGPEAHYLGILWFEFVNKSLNRFPVFTELKNIDSKQSYEFLSAKNPVFTIFGIQTGGI